ncbi:glycosyltransferase family 2 protein [Sporolactobacillus terrae]|uniref:glycosyltransferase family 2 protein n=1 Tax=Sporolactobacillus terrae TaxID=269673 RepID=UPI0021003F78|nr:glycosyltransferase family 2 protein [Sporolactobacillus terrae]
MIVKNMKEINKRIDMIKKRINDKKGLLNDLTAQIDEIERKNQQQINLLEQQIYSSYERMEQKLVCNKEKWYNLKQKLQKKDTLQTGTTLNNLRLGERLFLLEIISADQLIKTLDEQAVHGGRIGDILVHFGYVNEEQIQRIVDQSFTRLLLGEQLVKAGYLEHKNLEKALRYQEETGGDIGSILLSMGFITQDQLYEALAAQNQMGRLTVYDKQDLIKKKLPEKIARVYRAIVIRHSVDQSSIAVESLLKQEDLLIISEFLDTPVSQCLASPWEMEILWEEVYQEELLIESTDKLKDEQPENSASETFTFSQIIGMILIGFIIAASLLWNWFYTLIVINIGIQLAYFTMSVTKFLMILYGTREKAQLRFNPEEISAIHEKDLPIYTILVPMYKESKVIPQLINHLKRLDYPRNKLDIRLLIEKDDLEAQEMLQAMNLPYGFQMIVIPDGTPKTKPKACNYGLIRARGEYVVIYDAEDRPDPDQLKKVYLSFKSSSEDTVCIQAKLNYFNSKQNLLTKFFTQEYSNWFELLLPGIMQMKIPIPLGGTSNHFKTEVLKELGAWDPYNVTEDADLGIRLYKKRYTTKVVDSRTLEEANSKYGNWIRQRSRWIKGYMQTWLVHMRRPIKLHRELGVKGFWGAQFMLLSSPLLPMLNPIFWSLLVLWYATHAGWIPAFFPGPIYYLAAAQLILGNFLFIYSNMAGTYWVIHDLHRKKENWLAYGLVKYALLTPIYWIMMSLASFKALWQLIRKPFYWEKTEHGLDQHDQQNLAQTSNSKNF